MEPPPAHAEAVAPLRKIRLGDRGRRLFAFALGTEPEVALMIEARRGGSGGLRWEYGLAPLTSFEVKVSWKRTQVWSQPWRKFAKDPSDTFYDMYYSREPDARRTSSKTRKMGISPNK